VYHPGLGRFISQDPIGFDASDPNLYRYVSNNPVNGVDPTGLQEQELGGKDHELPECLHPGRLIFTPPTKDECLKGVPRWGKNCGPLSGDMRKKTCGTGTGWSGVVPDKWAVGPDGCGPCVGVALTPPKPGMPTYIIHVAPTQNIQESCVTVGFFKYIPGKGYEAQEGYTAVICGAEQQPNDPPGENQRLHTLNEVVRCLHKHGVKVVGYVPAPGFVVDKNGKVYWITPNTTPVDKYEK
jgi:hypothetical protein